MKDYKPELRSFLERLEKHGFTNFTQHNGEYGSSRDAAGAEQFLDDLLACDEANLYVTGPHRARITIRLVYGNEPGVIAADWTVPKKSVPDDPLDLVSDEHYEEWKDREQPTKDR